VRGAIKRIGGTLPENIPPAEHIKQVGKRIESIVPRLELDGQNAKGLIGGQSEKNDAEKEKDNDK
jgi:DNA-damage-inducible protein D